MEEKTPKYDPGKPQTVDILREAAEIVGSTQRLASALGVDYGTLAEWLRGRANAPDEIVQKAIAIIRAKRANPPRQ